jgi:hypothetical protein
MAMPAASMRMTSYESPISAAAHRRSSASRSSASAGGGAGAADDEEPELLDISLEEPELLTARGAQCAQAARLCS